MKYLIGVDVGSTFTDVICTSDGSLEHVKVETTPHDLTVCFMDGIKKCAGQFGDVEKILNQSEPIRWSSTVATNIIAMKKGSPVGLIVTSGSREMLTAKNVSSFVADDMIVELNEHVDANGNVVKDVDREELIQLVENLLDRGARVLAVSLQNSAVNAANEKKAKAILYKEYPEYYLGCTETFLASEITPRPDYLMRTTTTLLDAYIHSGLVKFLYKGDEELIQTGARYPMFIVQTTGGMARAAKTVAINTIGAGPTASLSYTSLLSRLYDAEPLIVFEVGGTTSNCSIGKKNGGIYRSDTIIEGLPLYLFSPDVTSIGLGGGTYIRLKEGRLEVGPESAGAVPGPACYDLGNDEPTMCDVNVVLGVFDPDYYEGGARTLVKELAVEALQPLAKELGVSVEKLCTMIRDVSQEKHVRLVSEKTNHYGIDPSECTMVVCGGEGPVHVCSAAESIGVKKVIVPQNSAIFGAAGCVLMDVVSMYESFKPVRLWSQEHGYFTDFESFNNTVDKLRANVFTDMKAQGFDPAEIVYTLELEVEDGAGSFRSILPGLRLHFTAEEDVKMVCQLFAENYARATGKNAIEEIKADIVRLKGVRETASWQPAVYIEVGDSLQEAWKGKRDVFWQDKYEETDVYQGEKLNCGNKINGPAVIEEKYTTIVLPAGWKCRVDQYLNKILEKV